MSVSTNHGNIQLIAMQLQKVREGATQAVELNVTLFEATLTIEYRYQYTNEEAPPHLKFTFDGGSGERVVDRVMTAIGDVLAENHTQLCRLKIDSIDFQNSNNNNNNNNNTHRRFWIGLAANRVLKEVCFSKVAFPNATDITEFTANPALETLELEGSTFPARTFDCFCQGLRSSLITKLLIRGFAPPQEGCWPWLWSALEHGAHHLTNLTIQRFRGASPGIETGLESLLSNNNNNNTLRELHLTGCFQDSTDRQFFRAIGAGLSTNATVEILSLTVLDEPWTVPTSNDKLLNTVFTAGLDRNVAIQSMTFETNHFRESVNALANGLERMMHNRSDTAIHNGRDRIGSVRVLSKLEIGFQTSVHCLRINTDHADDLFFTRLSRRSDVIPVKTIKIKHETSGPMLPSGVYDFIRSTRVTKTLVLETNRTQQADDRHCVDLADAMETNDSISELEVAGNAFHQTNVDLLQSPNKYRIHCQLRRNEIQVRILRKKKNVVLLPMVFARLLLPDETQPDEKKHYRIESRQLVDRTIAFEMMRDSPEVFSVNER